MPEAFINFSLLQFGVMDKPIEAPQEHSVVFLEMAFREDRCGVVENADGYGTRTGDCGDTVEMFLSITSGVVRLVTFRVQGCRNTLACGNAVSTLMEGKTLDEAWELTVEDVIDFLQSLSVDHHHCAELAVGSFYNALSDFNRRGKEGWKELYRRA